MWRSFPYFIQTRHRVRTPRRTYAIPTFAQERRIRLIDADRNDSHPLLNPWALDINKGNGQLPTASGWYCDR
ncbi:hypothetical protein GCM10028799_79460 [Kribbella italica]